LTEAEATPGPTDGGKGGQSPFTPGGYFYPSQLNPPQFTPKPYVVPGPVNPGQYSPHPPIDLFDWIRKNPPPNPANFPGGELDKDFQTLLKRWWDKYEKMRRIWQQWARERGAPIDGPVPWPYGDSVPLYDFP
jgi:hypothetical protein